MKEVFDLYIHLNFGPWAKAGCQLMLKDALMMQVFTHWERDS